MTSLTPDITERIPALLSAREVSSRGSSSSVLYDVVISGIGFVFDVSTQSPYQRQSESSQKEQIDTSTEAGEQTLGGPWVRSQTSWHLGAGSSYYEPGNRDETIPSKFRFKDSRGVNVWEQGSLSLHPKMDAVDSTALTAAVAGARLSGGVDAWYSRVGDTVYRHEPSGTTSYGTSAFIASGKLCPAGSVVLIGGPSGIYKVPATGAGAITALHTIAAGPTCTPYWAKGRVIVTRGPDIHQATLAGGVLDATTLEWTHPDASWEWTGVAETPDAILAAGRSSGTSAIYAFVLTEDAGGSVPKLSQPFQVAELPPGEEVRSIRSYLGLYLGIGTTAGVRVAVIGDKGQIQYGPLLTETDSPVVSLAARDSYLYAATGSSVIRVDLSTPIGDGLRFPYAYDVEVPSGTIGSIAFDGVSDRVVCSVDGTGTYAASTTETVASGWLESGAIRFGTTEPKAFRTVDVVASTPGSSSVAVAATVDDTVQSLVTLAQGKGGHGISLGSLPSPLAQLGYRLTLNGGADSPVVDAVAVKAVPLPTRQRLILYPVQLADDGRDAKNTPYGKKGYASTVLEALEALENSQTIVTVNDLTRPEQYEATIEQVRFTRVAGRRGGSGNFGGTAEITLRTL